MIKLTSILIFVLTAYAVYADPVFDISPSNPCAGTTIYFQLPAISGCTYPALVRSSLTIYPTPSSTSDIVRTEIGHQGVIGVRITYNTYTPSLISVYGPYTCATGAGGNVSGSISLTPPLSGSPTITGLDGLIYAGDSRTATASISGGGVTYSWSIANVSTVVGTINSSAIVSPSSASTQINFPSGFVGDLDIIGTATRCGSSVSTTKHVSSLYVPYYSFGIPATPAINCPGIVVGYQLTVYGGVQLTSSSVLLSAGGSNLVVTGTSPGGYANAWNVKWNADGQIRVDFVVKDVNNRTWSQSTGWVPFDVLDLNGGTLAAVPPNLYCSPAGVTLTTTTAPFGSTYAYQYCSTGNCGSTSTDWINNSPATSAAFSNLQTSTSFRIKLNETRCGVYTSNIVSMTVSPTPSVTPLDKIIFSGGTYDFPTPTVTGSTVAITASATNVIGASNITSVSPVASQTLKTATPADGTVVYTIVPSLNGCTGVTKTATVTVYKKPPVYATLQRVFKGQTSTLSTDSYNSYQWKTDTGTPLTTNPTYTTGTAGKYKVAVVRNGIAGESDVFDLGLQFSNIDENWILTREPLKEFNTTVGLEDKLENEVRESIQYFDGLSRPLQNIQIRNSPSSHDVVVPIAYDQYGREVKKYLPYVSNQNGGEIQYNAISTDQPQFYVDHDSKIVSDPKPYSEAILESSPLNRVTEQGSPGLKWQPGTNHTIKKYYLTNGNNEVLDFYYDVNTNNVTVANGAAAFYPPNKLHLNKTVDEQQNDVLEYVDFKGRSICKKVKAPNGAYASTYYVYDDLDNLIVVIQPEGVISIMDTLGIPH